MLTFLETYGRNYKYSQNREEGVLKESLRRLGIPQGVAVETGGHDGHFCSNTALLAEQGWKVLFVEADYNLYLKCRENWAAFPNVRSQCSRVDVRNIQAFITEECDVLSLDLDGSDYDIFCGMKARPKIVIVEIDSSIEPPNEHVNSDGGVGYWAMTVAALERGYFVLCHTGNLILVKQEYGHLFPECGPHPLLEWELYFNRSWL